MTRNLLCALDLATTTAATRFAREALALDRRLFRRWHRLRGDPNVRGAPRCALPNPGAFTHWLSSYPCGKIGSMATTTVSSKGQVVIPRHLREKHRLTSGVRLQIIETEEGLVLAPVNRTRPSAAQSGWRALRGSAKGTDALRQHLEEHRREAKR
jgi:AbrB family looped-hinge helix DNA binding protein